MNYPDIVNACKTLHYQEKLSLSVLLIQMARKEEEAQNPKSRVTTLDKKSPANAKEWADTLTYVIDHLPKNPPNTKKALLHSIATMYQFKGGISDKDAESIVNGLEKNKFLKVVENKRVEYGKG